MPAQLKKELAVRARAHVCAEFSDARFNLGVFRALVPLVREGLDARVEREREGAAARGEVEGRGARRK